MAVSTAANKALVRRYWDEVVNPGNLDLIDELYAPNFVLHAPDGDVYGPDGVRRQLAAYRAAFPDLAVTLEDLLAEGDKVVRRFTLRGTHRGPFLGVPVSGRRVELGGIAIDRVAGGLLVESWVQVDGLPQGG